MANVSNRVAVLAKLVDASIDDVIDDGDNCFRVHGQDWLVLTDGEAILHARAEIEQSLWAFNAEFIADHIPTIKDYLEREQKAVIHAIKKTQNELCEDANILVRLLLADNLNAFASKAIELDGREHFIATYDGVEHSVTGKEAYHQDLFLYRVG